MEYKDYYIILGVQRNADSAAIKRALRTLARQLHPDMNPGNSEAERHFKEVNEAYNVLNDEERRELYDRLGAQWQKGQHAGGFDWSSYFDLQDREQEAGPNYRTTSNAEEQADGGQRSGGGFFDSLLNNVPYTRRQRPRVEVYESAAPSYQINEQDLPIEISLEEAFWGTSRTVQQGGARLEISIPKGVKNGSKVRVSAPTGDLLLVVTIKAHPTFIADEANLRTTLTVDLYSALLGREVRVPTLEGTLGAGYPG